MTRDMNCTAEFDKSGFPLTGQWVGTASVTDNQGFVSTFQFSADFVSDSSSGAQVVTATLVYTTAGEIPEINSINFTVGNTSFSLTDITESTITAGGSVSSSNGQTLFSGSGTDNEGSGSGVMTVIDSFNISGELTTTTDSLGTGPGSLHLSPDGKHMTGSATGADGTTITWSADQQ
jgi:hypothetical protein